MDKNYVTKAELDMHSKVMDAKLDSIKEGTYSRIDNLNSRMDSLSSEIKGISTNLNDNMEKTIKLALHEKEDAERDERKETNRYIFGTLVLGGIGVLISIASIVFNL